MRFINLRSPYHVKVTSSTPNTKTLRAAAVDLYVWTGGLGNRPAEPTYQLSESVLGLQDFIVFEVSELARDQVKVLFTGTTRRTEPVYIGYEITKSFTEANATEERESGLVFGLDGYLNHQEGTQFTDNLFQDSGNITDNIDEDDVLTVTIVNTVTDTDTRFDFVTPNGFGFEATASLTNVSYQWQFRANNTADFIDIQGANASIYNIATTTLSDVGSYRVVATTQDGSNSAESNDIRAQAVTTTGTCNVDRNLAAGNPLVLSSSVGSTASFKIVCDPSTAFEDIIASDFVLPSSSSGSSLADASWVTPTVSSTVTDGARTTTITFTVNTTGRNNTGSSRDGSYILRVRNAGATTSNPFTIFLRQSSGAIITDVNVNTTTIPFSGGTVGVSVAGNVGATYRLALNPLSQSPNGWIDTSSFDEITGTVGDFHTLTIGENDTTANRTVLITAVNTNDASNIVAAREIVQASEDAYLRIVENNLSFAATANRAVSGVTLKLQANRPWRLEITEGTDDFAIYTPGLIDFSNPRIGESFDSFRVSNSPQVTDANIGIRALNANTMAQEVIGQARVVYLDDPTVAVDTITFTQAASAVANFNFLQDAGLSATSTTRLTSLVLDSDNKATFRVNSNTLWSISVRVPAGTTASQHTFTPNATGIGNTDVTVDFSNEPAAGRIWQLRLADLDPVTNDRATVHTIDINFAEQDAPPNNLRFLTSELSRITGQDADINVTATDPEGGTLSYTLLLTRNAATIPVPITIGPNTTGSFTIPAANITLVGTYSISFIATSSASNLSTPSPTSAVLTVSANPFGGGGGGGTDTTDPLLVATPGSVTMNEIGTVSSNVNVTGVGTLDDLSFVCTAPFTILNASSGTFSGTGNRSNITIQGPSLLEDRDETGSCTFSASNRGDAVVSITQQGEAIEGTGGGGTNTGGGDLVCESWFVRATTAADAHVEYTDCTTGLTTEFTVDTSGTVIMSTTEPVRISGGVVTITLGGRPNTGGTGSNPNLPERPDREERDQAQ